MTTKPQSQQGSSDGEVAQARPISHDIIRTRSGFDVIDIGGQVLRSFCFGKYPTRKDAFNAAYEWAGFGEAANGSQD